MSPFSVKNFKGDYYALSKHYEVNSTEQRGERGEVHGLWDKCRLVRPKEQWLYSSKAKRWEKGNKEKEERGSCWAAGLVGTAIII